MGLSIFTFVLTHVVNDPAVMYMTEDMTPGEIAAIREKYHLNDPLYIQYYYYICGLLRGDLGYSKTARDYVSRAILKKLPATFELAAVSLIVAVVFGIKAGVISAMRRNKLSDHITRIIALAGVSIPVFWLGLILLLVFYGQLQIIPIGRYDPAIWPQSEHHTDFYIIDAILNKSWRQLLDAFYHLITPAFVIGYFSVGLITRMTRSCMLEVANKDYVTTARAKGLPERVVVLKHMRRNALIPVVTVIGLTFGALLAGSVLTETVFHWPGLGSWAVKAIKDNDVPAVMNYILLVGVIYSLVNLMVDLVYGLLDPRVRY
jgi:peptide/nickel transport system permease protein